MQCKTCERQIIPPGPICDHCKTARNILEYGVLPGDAGVKLGSSWEEKVRFFIKMGWVPPKWDNYQLQMDIEEVVDDPRKTAEVMALINSFYNARMHLSKEEKEAYGAMAMELMADQFNRLNGFLAAWERLGNNDKQTLFNILKKKQDEINTGNSPGNGSGNILGSTSK